MPLICLWISLMGKGTPQLDSKKPPKKQTNRRKHQTIGRKCLQNQKQNQGSDV